jgi:hypothetical protein
MANLKFDDIDFSEVSLSDKLSIVQQLLSEIDPANQPPSIDQIKELAKREHALADGQATPWTEIRQRFIRP